MFSNLSYFSINCDLVYLCLTLLQWLIYEQILWLFLLSIEFQTISAKMWASNFEYHKPIELNIDLEKSSEYVFLRKILGWEYGYCMIMQFSAIIFERNVKTNICRISFREFVLQSDMSYKSSITMSVVTISAVSSLLSSPATKPSASVLAVLSLPSILSLLTLSGWNLIPNYTLRDAAQPCCMWPNPGLLLAVPGP